MHAHNPFPITAKILYISFAQKAIKNLMEWLNCKLVLGLVLVVCRKKANDNSVMTRYTQTNKSLSPPGIRNNSQ